MAISFRYLASAGVALLLIVTGAVWKWRHLETEQTTVSSPSQVELPPLRQVSPPTALPAGNETSRSWFRTRTDTGIDFRHNSGTSPEKPFPAANGSGIAALDYDLDGLCDLYFATGTSFPVNEQRSAPFDECYRNLGSWQFEKVTAKAGLRHTGYSAGVAIGDYNGDGFPDIYVACYQANVLYRNQGDGTYVALDSSSGALDARWATSTAMFDYDADGYLDVYVCNYGKWTLADNPWCGDESRNIRHYCSPRSVPPEFDALLRNRGDDTFEETTQTAGLAERAGRAQGLVAADLDGNGAIDLYVGNDLNANSLFLNEGNGKFRDASETSGVAYDYLGGMQAGMGVDSADTNADGRPELFVTNFEGEHNAFYHNVGDGFFQDVSQQRGLYSASLPWVGWGTAFADFDLDGSDDLIVTNGHVDDNREKVPYAAPPLLWKNVGGRFDLVGPEAGQYFQQDHVGRALVVADLDNDGHQDVVIGHQDAAPTLLQNVHPGSTNPPARKLMLRLIGTRCNRDAIGSTMTLAAQDYVRVLQVKGGGSYLSAHDRRLAFASPGDLRDPRMEIRWADGSLSVIDELPATGSYTIVQPVSAAAPTRFISNEAPQ